MVSPHPRASPRAAQRRCVGKMESGRLVEGRSAWGARIDAGHSARDRQSRAGVELAHSAQQQRVKSTTRRPGSLSAAERAGHSASTRVTRRCSKGCRAPRVDRDHSAPQRGCRAPRVDLAFTEVSRLVSAGVPAQGRDLRNVTTVTLPDSPRKTRVTQRCSKCCAKSLKSSEWWTSQHCDDRFRAHVSGACGTCCNAG